MPISGNTSYLQTTDEFANHWDVSNTTLGADGPLVLPDGTELPGLLLRRALLETRRAFLQGVLNVEEAARADLSFQRILLQGRLVQFSEKVRVFFGSTKWVNALPELPTSDDSPNAEGSMGHAANRLERRVRAIRMAHRIR